MRRTVGGTVTVISGMSSGLFAVLILVVTLSCDEGTSSMQGESAVSVGVLCAHFECCATGCDTRHPTFVDSCEPVAGKWAACRCNGNLQGMEESGSFECPPNCELVHPVLYHILDDAGASLSAPITQGKCPAASAATCDAVIAQAKAVGLYQELSSEISEATAACQ